MNPITSQALNDEFEQIALLAIPGLQKEAKKEGSLEVDPLTWGGAAAGASLGAGEMAARAEQISKTVMSKKPERVTIYYTDPRRGAGHLAQGGAVKEALARIGIEADLVNFDTEFGNKKVLEQYNMKFNRFRADPKKSAVNRLAYMKAYYDFYESIDKKKMAEAMGQKGTLPVYANPQLAWSANKGGIFHGVSMHTDQAAWTWMDPMTWKGGRPQRHIATESAKKGLYAQHPTIKARTQVVPDLAIKGMPDMSKKMVDSLTGIPIRMEGKFNITVSGGAQGWDTSQIARNLMKGNLPEGTIIHVVTGGNKQPNGTITASKAFAEAQKLEAATLGKRVQVRAYGWSPLRQMMGIADMNVLRPHGTTITEATAAGKPFILAIPDAPLAMEANDARAASKYVKQPAVSMNQLGATAEKVVNNYDVYHKAVKSKAQSAATASDEWAKAIASSGPRKVFPHATKPMFVARKALRFGAIPLAAAGAVGAFRTGQKVQQNKDGFYRTLPTGYKGKDPQGSPIIGKTWVRRRRAHEKVAVSTAQLRAGVTP
jgi:hypothetical protein